MTKPKILQEEREYTFRSYFEMTYPPEEILGELGYKLIRSRLSLPKTQKTLDRLLDLQERIERTLTRVSLTSETARRETLVAPVLLEVAIYYCDCQLRIEYPLVVSKWLKGNLDYLLRAEHNLLVVEAKNDDLTRGFTQLATELIALSQIEEQQFQYGAVTIGDVWRFGMLNVKAQQITEDITIYSLPDDLEALVRVLVGIIEDNSVK
ncbi:hypothetical protein I8752_36950 [Nostocaceae cyanobacterium CENA369]|uniref:Type I restriction enzyme R protein N-terminal domain-containing protein n=1 Tax=Dendronalium phyllosphericum CENA369 TaxID=1725256 RepID=A0A8J7I930_9NOST|nr:hypothetical protein [Dendronalium phyllosphericum]MBH8578430.1 hypothetical protein [Dendronalium phyllosphericum CENA369]